LISDKKYAILLIFSVGCLVRTIPELLAYPYPIGYDVINYYIPVVANFSTHWPALADQFPLYVLFLHFINIVSGLDAHITVTIAAILMFGIFAVSVFLMAQRLLKINVAYSILLSIFVIFQLGALRTTWDLHRDILGLSTMFLTFSLIHTKKEGQTRSNILIALTLSAVTASADGMLGALFVVSLVIYALITRTKIVILCTLIAIGFFAFEILPSQNIFHQSIAGISTGLQPPVTTALNPYNPINLLILFAVVNGPLIPTGIIGFVLLKDNLLKVPLLISVVGSFTWVVFPNASSLGVDSWIISTGIFLSIFAGYGIIRLVQKLNVKSELTRSAILLSIVGIFVIVGSAYAITPSDKPFFLYGIVRNNIETFVPITMQVQVSSSQDVKDNGKLNDAISWLNNNAEPNAIIVGDRDWRGWMEVGLKDHRMYEFPASITDTMNSNHQQGYLITYYTQKIPQLPIVYSNDKYRIFRVGS
jgi:hypothetical protein